MLSWSRENESVVTSEEGCIIVWSLYRFAGLPHDSEERRFCQINDHESMD